MYSALRKTVQHKHPTPKSQRCVQPLYSQLGWRKQGSIGGEIFSVISLLYKINPGVITIIYSEQELKWGRTLEVGVKCKGLSKLYFFLKAFHLGKISYYNLCASESCWTNNSRGKGLPFPWEQRKRREGNKHFLQWKIKIYTYRFLWRTGSSKLCLEYTSRSSGMEMQRLEGSSIKNSFQCIPYMIKHPQCLPASDNKDKRKNRTPDAPE